MNELALFAGAGGGLLASEILGWRTICAVEYGVYPASILCARQNDGFLPPFPIWNDIQTFDGRAWNGIVDIISGGFPCQAFSTAARGANIASKNLWSEMRRVVQEVRPKFVFAENVTEIAIEMATRDLLADGYNCKYIKLSAADMGADHIRERFWLLAYTDMHCEFRSSVNAKMESMSQLCSGVWQTIPDELRVFDGMANRMDRLKAVGNGQIPLVAAVAFLKLWEGIKC